MKMQQLQFHSLRWLIFAFYFATFHATASCDAKHCSSGSSLVQLGQRRSLDQVDKARSVDYCIVQDNICQDRTFHTLDFHGEAMSMLGAEMNHSLSSTVNQRASLRVQESLRAGDVEIVVTRFTEDVRWLDAFGEINTIIYNRGPVDSFLPTPRSNLQIISEPNIGREDQVMLNHIAMRYDKLAKVTIFLQGWPFGHCPGLIDAVGDTLIQMLDPKKGDFLRSLGNRLYNDGNDGIIPLSSTFRQYSIADGQLGLATELLQYHHQLGDKVPAMEYARKFYLETCKLMMGGLACPELQWVAEGAQWAVTRDRIHMQTKTFYEKALRFGEGFEEKYRGLILEALWPIIWSGKYWDPTKAQDVSFDEGPGVTKQTIRAKDHCRDHQATSQGLLWSCHEHLGVCEFNKQRAPEVAQSTTFLSIRQKYQIEDRTPWSMIAELRPFFGGATTFSSEHRNPHPFLPKFVESLIGDGSIHLQPAGPFQKTAIEFNITEGRKGFYTFATATGPLRYLGCDVNTGVARLLPSKYEWNVDFVWDGLSQLNSVHGQLSLKREDGGHLRCHAIVKKQNKETSFLIAPVLK
jgi:hypothetical protein